VITTPEPTREYSPQTSSEIFSENKTVEPTPSSMWLTIIVVLGAGVITFLITVIKR
jgi:multisubunit Na+/H+ antiporter MnhC subunit